MTARRPFVLALVLAAACSEGGARLPVEPEGRDPDDPPPPPTAQVVAYRLVLDTPHDDDGALLLRIRGGGVDSVTSTAARVSSAAVGASERSVLLWGRLADGTVATIWIPARDAAGPDVHSAALEQAAARVTYAQRDPASYALRLERITR